MQDLIPSNEYLEKRDQEFADRFNLTFKISLSVLLLLVFAGIFTQNSIIKAQSNHAIYQSIAGNQKMLSQRISMLSMALLTSDKPDTNQKIRESLLKNSDLMQIGQQRLLNEHHGPGISQAARHWLTEAPSNLDFRTKRFIENAQALASADKKEINLKNQNLHSIISASSKLLEDFETLTKTLQQDGIEGVKKIRRYSNIFSVLTALLILGLGFFVFAPLLTRLDFEFRERSRFQKKLIASNKDLEQFASIAAHDIRAPLHNIKAFAELLSDESIKKDAKTSLDYLGQISRGVERLEQLVKDLLDYSRTSSGELKLESVNLNQLFERLKVDYLGLIQEAKLVFEQESLPNVTGDQILLNVLFKNIISNSVKYSTDQTQSKIKIYSKNNKQKPPQLEIIIEDNGMGFDPDKISDVFKAFHRQTKASKFQGSGLGLAICHRIVRKHKGSIFAENTEEGGARIRVILPVSKHGN